MELPLIRPADGRDAPRLAELVTAYRAAMSRTRPVPAMTEVEAHAMIDRALAGPGILLLGAETRAGLVGFAHAFDLPEIISGARAGQLDDLFVTPEARGAGAATALIGRLAAIGRARGWNHLRWLVPQDNAAARRLYEKIAEPAPWDSFHIDLSRREDQARVT